MDGPSTPPARSSAPSSPPSVHQSHRDAVQQGQREARARREARGSRRNLLSQFDEIASEQAGSESFAQRSTTGGVAPADAAAPDGETRNSDQPPLMPPPRPQRRTAAHREPSTPPPSNHGALDDFSPFHGSVASLGSPMMESDHSVTAAGASSNRDDLLLSDNSGGVPGYSNASILLSASALPVVPERNQPPRTPPRSVASARSPSQTGTPGCSPEHSPQLRSATAVALWRSRRRTVAGAGARGTSRSARLRQMQAAATATGASPSPQRVDSAAQHTQHSSRASDAASVLSAGSARSLVSLQALMTSVATGAPPPGVTANRPPTSAPSAVSAHVRHHVSFSGVPADSSSATPRASAASDTPLHAPSPIRKRGAGASRLSTEDAQSLRSSASPAASSASCLPEASPLRPPTARERARALLAAPPPGGPSEGGGAPAPATTPSSSPTVSGIGSHLPLRLEQLCKVSNAVDSVAKAMTNRGPGLLTFEKLKPSVQSITQRLLTLDMLRQVVGVAPDMYALSRKAMDSQGRPLTGAAARKERNWRTVLLLQGASSVEFPKRRAKFRAACRALVASQHEAFLRGLGYTLPALLADGKLALQPETLPRLALPVLRSGSWHPDFKLEDVTPPSAPLPPPSNAAPVLARELLRGTADPSPSSSAAQRGAVKGKMTPTVARALTHAAASQGRAEVQPRTPPRAGGVKRSAALALLASEPPPPAAPSHVTLSDSSASAGTAGVHDSGSAAAHDVSAEAEGPGVSKSQRKSSVQFSPMRTPQRDSSAAKPVSRLYDVPTGGSVSTAPPLRAAVAVGASPATVASAGGLHTPAGGGQRAFGSAQQDVRQGSSHRTLHFPSSASAGSGDSADAAAVLTVRDRARAALSKPPPQSGEGGTRGSSSATTVTVDSAVATGSTAGASASASELPAELAFLRKLGAGGILARTKKRTEASEAAATPSAVQQERAQHLCKALPQLFDAVQTQFVLTGRQVMELLLLLGKLNKAYRDRGQPTTEKALLDDLYALAKHAHEWCSIKKGAASGKSFFRVRQLQQQRITAIRSALTRIQAGDV